MYRRLTRRALLARALPGAALLAAGCGGSTISVVDSPTEQATPPTDAPSPVALADALALIPAPLPDSLEKLYAGLDPDVRDYVESQRWAKNPNPLQRRMVEFCYRAAGPSGPDKNLTTPYEFSIREAASPVTVILLDTTMLRIWREGLFATIGDVLLVASSSKDPAPPGLRDAEVASFTAILTKFEALLAKPFPLPHIHVQVQAASSLTDALGPSIVVGDRLTADRGRSARAVTIAFALSLNRTSSYRSDAYRFPIWFAQAASLELGFAAVPSTRRPVRSLGERFELEARFGGTGSTGSGRKVEEQSTAGYLFLEDWRTLVGTTTFWSSMATIYDGETVRTGADLISMLRDGAPDRLRDQLDPTLARYTADPTSHSPGV